MTGWGNILRLSVIIGGLDPETAEGPGYLWRFLHNVNKKPSTIADRADYIEAELKKPESERLLRVQELDDQQRMYKK